MIETWSLNMEIAGVCHDIAEFTNKKDAIAIAKIYHQINHQVLELEKNVIFESIEDYCDYFDQIEDNNSGGLE